MWFSPGAGLIYSLILIAETSHSSTSSASLIIFSSFDDAALKVGGDWLKILVSIYIFFVISNPDYIFLCLFFWEINFFVIFNGWFLKAYIPGTCSLEFWFSWIKVIAFVIGLLSTTEVILLWLQIGNLLWQQ